MSERYTRVYTLPENLYLDGSPVLIAAGALLKDNKTGNILAQLKLCNLYHSRLTACKVHVWAFTPGGDELMGVEGHSYLDISIPRGSYFGSREAVPMPDNTTRKISVGVIQAVFEDGTVWQHSATEWSQLEISRQALTDRFPDPELAKQYSIELGGGNDCFFTPETVGSVYLCTCGTVNLIDEKECSCCHRDAAKVLSALDLEKLTSRKDMRLEMEKKGKLEREHRENELRKERELQAEKERLKRERMEEELRVRKKAARKKRLITGLIICGFITVGLITVAIMTQVVIPANRYDEAERLLKERDYENSAAMFYALGDYKDAPDRFANVPYIRAEDILEDGNIAKAAIEFSKLDGYLDSRERSLSLWDQAACRDILADGNGHTVLLCDNGIVAATGNNDDSQCEISNWSEIVGIAAGDSHTVGLKTDGTAIAVGNNKNGQCEVADWTDIVAIAAGTFHTVGLKSDGTVVAVGYNKNGQCEVADWTDIVAVAAGTEHTVGLKTDGTVVAVGSESRGRCDVSDWTDIVAIAAGNSHTVGLKSDGTVVAVGYDYAGQCDVLGWTNIVAVIAGGSHTIGLKTDGTLVAVGSNSYGQCEISDWTDVVAVAAGDTQTVYLNSSDILTLTGGRDGYHKWYKVSTLLEKSHPE